MRILLVEDDDLRRAATRRMLETNGYSVLEAGTGEQALALLRAAESRLVVLLDYLLPEMSGNQLLERIAAEPELALCHTFLVMSAHPALIDPPLPQLQGRWTRVVPKPIEVAQLRAAVALATNRPGVRLGSRPEVAEPHLAYPSGR